MEGAQQGEARGEEQQRRAAARLQQLGRHLAASECAAAAAAAPPRAAPLRPGASAVRGPVRAGACSAAADGWLTDSLLM
jgi:hypothetical protein